MSLAGSQPRKCQLDIAVCDIKFEARTGDLL